MQLALRRRLHVPLPIGHGLPANRTSRAESTADVDGPALQSRDLPRSGRLDLIGCHQRDAVRVCLCFGSEAADEKTERARRSSLSSVSVPSF